MRPVDHTMYDEIERGIYLSADDFQVAVVEGGRVPHRQPLQRMAGFKAYGTEANLVGNQ